MELRDAIEDIINGVHKLIPYTTIHHNPPMVHYMTEDTRMACIIYNQHHVEFHARGYHGVIKTAIKNSGSVIKFVEEIKHLVENIEGFALRREIFRMKSEYEAPLELVAANRGLSYPPSLMMYVLVEESMMIDDSKK